MMSQTDNGCSLLSFILAMLLLLDQWFLIRFEARTPLATKNYSRTPCTVNFTHELFLYRLWRSEKFKKELGA